MITDEPPLKVLISNIYDPLAGGVNTEPVKPGIWLLPIVTAAGRVIFFVVSAFEISNLILPYVFDTGQFAILSVDASPPSNLKNDAS